MVNRQERSCGWDLKGILPTWCIPGLQSEEFLPVQWFFDFATLIAYHLRTV